MAFPLSLLRPVPHEGMEGGFGGSECGHPESEGDIVPEAVNHGQADSRSISASSDAKLAQTRLIPPPFFP